MTRVGEVTLRPLEKRDPAAFSAAFSAIGWSKPVATFERYLSEQASGDRWVRVAERAGQIVGYVTLVWSSPDPELRRAAIPEIMDLNVLPAGRNRGIGRALMDAAESEARTRASRVGLRVGLHSGYGAAQRLYVRRGYVPDGSGAIRNGEVVAEGATVPLDDDLSLRMILLLGQAPTRRTPVADLVRATRGGSTMEPRLGPLAEIFSLNTDLLTNCVRDLTESQANRRLQGGGNSIAFLVAHLADARYFLVALLGSPLQNPLAPLLADAQSIEDIERMPSLGAMVEAWTEVSAHLSEVLRGLTAEDLDATTPHSFPIPGGSVLDAIAFLAQHDSYHIGQMAFLRRQSGLEAMKYDRPA